MTTFRIMTLFNRLTF